MDRSMPGEMVTQRSTAIVNADLGFVYKRSAVARRTAKSGIKHGQTAGGVPSDVVGGGAEREAGIGAEAMD